MVCLTISYFQLVKKKYSDPDLLISVSTQILLASKDQWSPDSSNSWLLPACLKNSDQDMLSGSVLFKY